MSTTTLTKRQRLLAEAGEAAKAALAIAKTAEDDNGREMTTAERADFDQKMAEANEKHAAAEVAKADEAVLEKAAELAKFTGLPESAKADLDAQLRNPTREQVLASFGKSIVDSPEFKAAISKFTDGHVPTTSHFGTDPIAVKSFIRQKSLFTGGSDTSAGAFVTSERTNIVEMLGRRDLRLRDLVSVRTTSSDTVEYVAQTSHTNNAAEVAEATSSAAPTQDGSTGPLVKNANGGYAPEGAWAFEVQTANVREIAEWVPATKRALADAGQLAGLIDDELRKDIEEREDYQLMAGNGTGQNLKGFLEWSGTQGQSFDTDLFTSVRKGITKCKKIGRAVPTGIAMSPEDVEQVDLAQDNNDRWYSGGPFAMGPRTLWGYPIVETETLAAGTAVVADFSKGVLWDREQTSVQMTDSHEDFFVRGLVAVKATERVAFAVTRPKAVVITETAA